MKSAINLSPANYWTQQPFVDRMKVRGEWVVQGTGWYVMVPMDSPGAVFEALYDGASKLRIANTISSEPGRIVFRAAADLTKPQLTLKASGEIPVNLRIVRQDQLPLLAAGEVFQPEFLEDMRGFASFRCMDWMETNGSTRTDVLIEDDGSTYSRGVPLSVIVALANCTGMRPWINVPHLATDAAIVAMLKYLNANLRAGIKAIVEYSNECWNWDYAQTKWLGANKADIYRAYGLQCARLAKLARGYPVGVVIAGWWVGLSKMKAVLAGIAEGGATDADFEGVAPAAYVGYPSGTSDLDMANKGSVDAALDLIRSDLPTFRNHAAEWAAFAKAHGWKPWTYEGLEYHLNVNGTKGADGKKLTKTQLAPLQVFAQSVQMDPRSGPLLMEYIDVLADAGFDMGTIFNYAGPATVDGFFGIRWQPAWPLLRARMAPPAVLSIEERLDALEAWRTEQMARQGAGTA